MPINKDKAVPVSKYNSYKEYPGAIMRQGPFNIDTSSMFTSLEAATEYAKTSPIAYEGQILTITEENADGSTSLYYMGIKNHVVTDDSGNQSLEPQLVQIMTLIDSQNLLHNVGAIKYRGTIGVSQTPDDPEVIHTTFAALTNGYINPEAGDMYNVYFSNAEETQLAHVVSMLKIEPTGDTYGTYPESDKITIGDIYYYDAEGNAVSFIDTPGIWEDFTSDDYTDIVIRLNIGEEWYGVFGPSEQDCRNYMTYVDQSNCLQLFMFRTLDTGFDAGSDGKHFFITIRIPDQSQAIEELDRWARNQVPTLVEWGNFDGTNITLPKEAHNVVKQLLETINSDLPICLGISQQLRNGDNIVYNGKYWDVLSGLVDLRPYATKDELAKVQSSATTMIYRQE